MPSNPIPPPLSAVTALELLRSARRVVVKVGSNLLARRDGDDPFARLAADLAALRPRELVLVSSGAIALGWGMLGLQRRPHAIALSQASAAAGQPHLMARWEQALAGYDMPVAQLLLTADGLGHRDRFLNARHAVQALLEHGVVPVVNENDTVAVDEIRFGDNDHLSALCTNLVSADALVLLTDQPGLLSADPRTVPAGQPPPALVRTVTEADMPGVNQLLAAAAPTRHGTGGMGSKVNAARVAARHGVPAVIADGRRAGVLPAIFDGDGEGTLFVPDDTGLRSRKGWIAAAVRPAGAVVVDDGAKQAILHGGKSLLPIGIVEVKGDFGIGDAVDVIGADGRTFARGLVSYTAADVRRLQGRRTGEIESMLGYRNIDEVVHRDDLVLL